MNSLFRSSFAILLFAGASPLYGESDLALTMSDAPDPLQAGANITYTISVQNLGPNAAANVTLTDAVPANTTFVSFSAPAGWSVSAPAVGGTGTVSSARASVSADDGLDSDPDSLAALGGTVLFAASSAGGHELWKSDGTATGTVQPKDIHPAGDSYPGYLINVNGTIRFQANDGALIDNLSNAVTRTVRITALDDTPRIVSIGPATGNPGTSRLTFCGIAGRKYTIEFTATLDPEDWQPLGTVGSDALGLFDVKDTPPPGTMRRFYRARFP